ncbi:hypothetical protein GO730_09080 [Spirosoma sp. HMF3257]|uniref:Uncharacterized protein n=1 Tax=Spirosoma telluris TaxID=2183553 RepID=A0A327NHV4_9BACT|nr:hypothetical protein [Spirosoma telluris]RAI74395.1 hypothetical protein HMF3257_08990 [Spirosoma telluris]
MNQTFSIIRFGRLLRKYFIDNRGQLLANTGLLICSLFVLGAFVYQGSPGSVSELRYILFFMLGWPCWYVFTLQQTSILNQKERAITYLMQPASQAEKIMLIWLISGLGFRVVYLSVFGMLDAIGTAFVNNRNWSPEQVTVIRMQGGLFQLKSFFDEKSLSDIPAQLWVFTALLHSFTLAFSLLVRRYTLPLVIVIAFALIIFGTVGNNMLLHTLAGSSIMNSITPFAEAVAKSPSQYRTVNLPQPIGNQLRYLIGITVIILLYITAYVRLKEREV